MVPQDPIAEADDESCVAIIGMSGRFPDANSLEQFWRNLRDGVDSVRAISDEELRQAGVDETVIQDKNYIKVASMLTGFEWFDAEFFGISPREAELMDPQHRLFMECCWEVLEHAGYSPRGYEGAIGVYAGVAESAYLFENIATNPRVIESVGMRAIMQANQKDFLCGRVAHELDLRGPAVVVQTACSTSLVAVHIACQSVLNGECDIALAGGVAISNLTKTGYHYVEGGYRAADGHCRAFDSNATGIVDGSGIGIVALKRLRDARRDGDTIHAIIRGSAINNDGADKISFTAPSVRRQAAAISEAHAIAGVSAETITYVEAHGTGTMLGDPIEVRALTQAFAASTAKTQFCRLGSVKTNLGHLDTAAGIAGLIKTVLALKHREIPPSLHFEQPNPHIDFDNSPFIVNATLSTWPAADSPRRAGVSSFGVGGTNAHVVLEEAGAAPEPSPSRRSQVLLFSAKTPQALSAATANFTAFLQTHPETNLADAAYTLALGREHFRYRRSVSCADHASAIDALKKPFSADQFAGFAGEPSVVFMFPGGGTQYVNMARELYESEDTFHAVIDECAAFMRPILQLDLRTVLFAEEGKIEAATQRLSDPQLIVSTLFAIEYALAKQLMAWGVKPDAMVGHSLGEYVAATLAGVFSLPDALRIVTERGRLIATLPSSNMVAVLLPPEELQSRLGEGLWLACVNSQHSCTIAGTQTATEKFAEQLSAEGVACQLLRGWPGSHSGLMEPILEQFRAALANTRLNAPSVPYLSNFTGDWIKPEEATNPDYWLAHLRHTVRFADCVRCLLQTPGRIYIEVGPGHTLSNLLKKDVPSGQFVAAVTSLPRRCADGSSLTSTLQAIGQLWAFGCAIDWNALYSGEARRRIALPVYPFQRKRYWIKPGARALGASPAADDVSDLSMGGEAARIVGENAAFADPDGGAVAYTRPELPTPYVSPQSQTEKTLSGIWGAILGVSPIGVHDDFFLLGGSSLVAIQLVSRIRSTFNADVPLRTLFRVSTVAAQAQEIEAVARELSLSNASQITPRPADYAPLLPSYAQQRLLFTIEMNSAADAAYRISKSIRIRGPLDKQVLRRVLDRIVERHESLRTRFATVDGQTVQQIAPATGFALTERDLTGLTASQQAGAIARINAEEARAAFDLSSGPLIRGQLLQLLAAEHILLVTQHHLISDGWSIGIMVREVSALYDAFTKGAADPLPPLPIQYADFAVWQRRWLQGEVLQSQTQFWKEHLSGAPALLELPADRARPAIQSHVGGRVQFELSSRLTAGLRELSQRHGATLFMTLLTAWAIVLARLSGQSDVVIGTPVANRQRREIESLIGLFVNTLALRVRLHAAATVAQMLDQVKSTTLSAYEHQDVPFDQVVEALQPPRSMSYNPVFQAMLNVHNTPGDSDLVASDLTFTPDETVENTALCDVMLSIQIRGDAIAGDLNYASDLFEKSTIERYAGYLQSVLGWMVAAEHRRASELPLMSENEQRLVLYQFNDTAMEYAQQLRIHQLFEEQVLSRTIATAVKCGAQQLTYDELNRRANRLAHELRDLGVGPDERVALCMERGLDMIVGLLGVLKAGGAYVPLDPGYPAERLAYMLEDSAPAAVLTQEKLWDRVSAARVPVIMLDGSADRARIATRPEGNPDPDEIGLTSNNVAYVIYTSGSTGVPKGVMIEHRNTVNFITWARQTFAAEVLASTLFSTSINFDLHVFELFVPLCCGGAITLVEGALAAGVDSAEVSLINTVPSAVQALVEHGRIPPSVRQINLAGEPLKRALVERLFASTSARVVANLYGPSETTTYSTWIEMDRAQGFKPYIGRPVANTQVYILDAHAEPVPIGVVGEIHIGGAGVARGYLNRPELTNERFVKDPFSVAADARMYRTGDLGRWRTDGNIEFLCRNDFQVKIRGFRIELGEIEARLSQCAGVKEAVVLAREDEPDEKRLVAYVTAQDGAELSATQLRSELSTLLVDYMVPSAFMVLEALPLTPNGKLDRQALPKPDKFAMATREYAAPIGDMEAALASIWQELLHVERVGRHDNFFDLGGHSLLAVQLVGRIREQCQVEGTLNDLFENPFLFKLAERVIELQLASFMDQDVEKMKTELSSLSERELLDLMNSESSLDELAHGMPGSIHPKAAQ